jgi:adenylylsulfate kinase
MLLIQLTGLSGAGKTTIANGVKKLLEQREHRVEVIDADIYRKLLCNDLGFSKEDRNENIRRLGFVANLLATNGAIAILAAINPYDEIRQELRKYGPHVNTVWINCDIATLIERDTKQLYKQAMLPDNHPGKIKNLSGINDPYEVPQNADLVIHTNLKPEDACIETLFYFILEKIQ